MLPPEFCREPRRIASQDKSETHPAFFTHSRVVQLVRLHQALRIATLWNPLEVTLVDQAIMHQRIDDSVEQYP